MTLIQVKRSSKEEVQERHLRNCSLNFIRWLLGHWPAGSTHKIVFSKKTVFNEWSKIHFKIIHEHRFFIMTYSAMYYIIFDTFDPCEFSKKNLAPNLTS